MKNYILESLIVLLIVVFMKIVQAEEIALHSIPNFLQSTKNTDFLKNILKKTAQNEEEKINMYTFLSIAELNPNIVLDIKYATTDNFIGQVVYPEAGCFLRAHAAHALNKVQKELEEKGLGLKVFDAYRPLEYQELFWKIMPDEHYVANPKKGSKHNRGAAVDLTLIRLSNREELKMPSAFDDFSEKAHRNYTASTEEAINCKFLEDIMVKHGFVPWPYEWWHFDFYNWQEYPIEAISFKEIKEQNSLKQNNINKEE